MDLSKHAFFEGKIVPLSEAKISIATHGFLYGTAVFGGVRAYWNEDKNNLYVFRPYDHFRRLLHSTRMMSMQTRYDEESLSSLRSTSCGPTIGNGIFTCAPPFIKPIWGSA